MPVRSPNHERVFAVKGRPARRGRPVPPILTLASLRPVAFRGWPAEAIEFFEGLEADNSKAYWQEHRATYDAAVRAPMEALLAELAANFGPGRVFRPQRDIRFSADKSPYKTAIGAMVGEVGYVQVSARGLGLGSGMWAMAADQLERYRQAVADEVTGPELVAVVADVRRRRLDVTGRETLKVAPRGYPRDHPRVELLRHKGLIAWREWPPGAWLGRRSARERVVRFLDDTRPLTDWLTARVGPSTLAPGRPSSTTRAT